MKRVLDAVRRQSGSRTTVAVIAAAVLASAGAVAGSGAVTPRAEAPGEARALSRAFAAAARAIRPSVVRIDVEMGGPKITIQGKRMIPDPSSPFFDFFRQFGPDFELPEPGPNRGTGSGVVVDRSGNIVTNRHVVQGASKVTVTLQGGRELSAQVVGKDARTDVAVVRLDKAPGDLTAARFGDSDKLEVGEWVLAVGSPLGLDQTVTAGIVSGMGRARGRTQMSGDRVRSYVQTDAKINPGNSGGPLVNLDGEVVGINTLINGGPGGSYGFAIPINEVRRVAQALIKDGRIRYAYLGVRVGSIKDMDEQARKLKNTPEKGAVVAEVTPGSPAEKAGLRPNDIIVNINGQKIEGANDVVDDISSQSIGSRVTVSYVRDGRPASVQVTLGELPSEDREAATGKIGLALQDLTPDLAESLGLDASTRGAVITEVEPGTPAQRAGLKAGDVVVEIDRRPVTNAEGAVAALAVPHKGGHLLRVKGPNGTRFITIP